MNEFDVLVELVRAVFPAAVAVMAFVALIKLGWKLAPYVGAIALITYFFGGN